MMTPHEEIETFLEGCKTSEANRLEMAIRFAASMVEELHACMAKWQVVERELEGRKRQMAVSCN